MKQLLDISYGSDKMQKLDIYLPDCEAFPVFVYYHGGGLTAGDKAKHQMLFQYLVSKNVAAVSVNYRLYPEASYPQFIEDAAQAANWVFCNLSQYGKVEGIYLGGSSAGGYLSMMLCFDERWLGKYGLNSTNFSGFVHDAGQPTTHFNVLHERGLDKRRVIVDDAAPLFHIAGDKDYPPMLIVVSDNDMENRYEQTMLLVSTLRHFGYANKDVTLKVMNGTHCAYVKQIDEAGESVFGKIICEFIQK